MSKVLVYGTLRRGEGNHRVMEAAVGTYLATLELEGFVMHKLHGGFPGVQKKHGSSVVCELYEVEDMNPLDWLEGYNDLAPESGLYNRMQVHTPLGLAWIYTINGELYGDEIKDWVKGE